MALWGYWISAVLEVMGKEGRCTRSIDGWLLRDSSSCGMRGNFELVGVLVSCLRMIVLQRGECDWYGRMLVCLLELYMLVKLVEVSKSPVYRRHTYANVPIGREADSLKKSGTYIHSRSFSQTCTYWKRHTRSPKVANDG
jgi:hypothetical protein